MGTRLQVLIVEDSHDDAALLVRQLRREGYDPTSERVETAAAMGDALSRGEWDVILCDYAMPQFTGLGALKLLKEEGLDYPFIIVSGAIGEETAVEALKAGAHDYIMKSNLTRLGPAIERELREAEGRRERRRAELQIREYQESLRRLASELSLAEERERRRIATYLHDRVSQDLIALKLKLEFARESCPSDDTGANLAEVLRRIDEIIEETRAMTFELCPPILYDVGLAAGLEWLVGQFQSQHGITAEFKDEGLTGPFDGDIRACLFQAARELLANVARHAQASRVEVSVGGDDHQATIHVWDDGVGIDNPPLDRRGPEGGGFGLFSIRERLTYFGGQLLIQSQPGNGTKISLLLPHETRQRPGMDG